MIFSFLTKKRNNFVAHLPIAGLKYYRAPELMTLMKQGDELTLQYEPDNPHDANAIVVLWRRNKIGYIPSEHCSKLNHLFKGGFSVYGIITDCDPVQSDSQWVKLNIYSRK